MERCPCSDEVLTISTHLRQLGTAVLATMGVALGIGYELQAAFAVAVLLGPTSLAVVSTVLISAGEPCCGVDCPHLASGVPYPTQARVPTALFWHIYGNHLEGPHIHACSMVSHHPWR